MRGFEDVKQGVWIRVGALGDLLVATAALQETLEKFPNAKLWIIGPKLWTEIIDPKLWPRINGIIVVTDKKNHKNLGELYLSSEEGWRSSGAAQPLFNFYKQAQLSVNHRVESYRFAWGPWLAKVRYRFGTCPWPMKWLYTHWSPWLGKDPILHERDRHLKIIEAQKTQFFPLGFTLNNRAQLKKEQTGDESKKAEKYSVFQPHQSPQTLAYKWRARALPSIHRNSSETQQNTQRDVHKKYQLNKKYWAVNPTSSRWEKAWSREKFKEFVLKINPTAEAMGAEIIILGAPNETDWLKFVAGEAFRVLQPSSIQELIQIVAHAELLITNTSSVQFIASATKTPSFVFMGRTFPARWGPLGVKDVFVAGRAPRDFKGNIFEEDFAGYDSISVAHAEQEFQKFLAQLND